MISSGITCKEKMAWEWGQEQDMGQGGQGGKVEGKMDKGLLCDISVGRGKTNIHVVM